GKLHADPESQTSKMAHLVTHSDRTNPPANPQPINVYYVPDFRDPDVFGLTSRPRSNYAYFNAPTRSFVIINLTYHQRESTFAHELGHALIDDGSHPNWDALSDHRENLMCSGNDRSATHNHLCCGQIGAARRNIYAF